MRYRADFHIHSCLSPCASLEMSMEAIVYSAKKAGMGAIALSDHNCTFNLPAFAEVCARYEMPCLFGMEVTSSEEAHMLCLFDDLDNAMQLGRLVYDSLPNIHHDPTRFGDQPVVNANDEVINFVEKYLHGASEYSVSSLLELVHSLGGLFIPAHIDRSMYGIISQLGFLPDEAFDAIELTARGNLNLAGHYPIVRNSDSHDPSSIGSAYTEYELDELTIENIRDFLWSHSGD